VGTLVVSDLHLGSRLGHDVLRRREPLERLLAELQRVERLVLLGDIVELAEGRPRQAMEIAEPVLRAIGRALGPDREAVIVPGNHDAPFVRGWVRATGRALAVDATVEADATPALARVAGWLSPARVRVHYPGVWLSERVWATHGHYLDRHLLPDSAVGIARGLLGRLPRDGAKPLDYELAGGVSATRVEALLARWLPGPLAVLFEDLAELIRAATMPRQPRRIRLPLHRRIAPLTARVLGFQMRRASIPALARVVHRLGVDAEWVVFGHVHRLGPMPGDDPADWRGPHGRPRVANTGAWVYQPLLVHRASPPHPYWPGGGVLLEPGGDPRAVSLLDDLDVEALHGSTR
jgi:UDP-2,3-diacylglucosamine pyrophosphatase LpxH